MIHIDHNIGGGQLVLMVLSLPETLKEGLAQTVSGQPRSHSIYGQIGIVEMGVVGCHVKRWRTWGGLLFPDSCLQ